MIPIFSEIFKGQLVITHTYEVLQQICCLLHVGNSLRHTDSAVRMPVVLLTFVARANTTTDINCFFVSGSPVEYPDIGLPVTEAARVETATG